MSLSEMVEAGNCILFVGAGFSLGAASSLNEPIRSGNGLRKFLLSECGIPITDDYDLESASEEYIESKSEITLIELLHKNFMTSAVSEDQKTIVCQPWYRIYTSNYDDVIERCCKETSKRFTTKNISDPVEPPLDGVTQVIHIYGSAERLSASEFRNHFLLTESQLDKSPFFSSAWFTRFSDDVLSANHVLFVGFSLRDIDIRRLMRLLPSEVKRKVRFVDFHGASAPAQKRFARFGTVSLIGVEGVATELQSRRPGLPVRKINGTPTNVEEMTYTPKLTANISGSDINYLFLTGSIDRQKFSAADVDGTAGSYTFKRSKASYSRVLSARPGPKPILIHSDVGNGKTVFIEQISYMLTQAGRKVYSVLREPESAGDIIAFASMNNAQIAIVFDDILLFKTLIKRVIEITKANILVIVTCRSALLETAPFAIEHRLGTSVFTEIDLNITSVDEVKGIVRYLDENALFGELAELDLSEREKYVHESCGGQVRDIVLSLFEAGSLHSRVLALLNPLVGLDQRYKDVLIFGAILTIGGIKQFGALSIVAELLDFQGSYEDLRGELIKYDVLGLIQLDSSNIAFRSSALALFILRSVFNLNEVLRVVQAVLFSIDRIFGDDKDFDVASRALLKFSLYNKLLKSKQDEVDIEDFYDACRVLKLPKKDPLFLVQRSINAMHYRRFDLSRGFIKTAYARARGIPSFDTYQIDTHFAKLLLTEALFEGLSVDLKNEEQAQDLLESVISRKSDDLYHPLSVMRLYLDLVKSYLSIMDSDQKLAMKKLVDRASQKLNRVPASTKTRFSSLKNIQRGLQAASKRLIG